MGRFTRTGSGSGFGSGSSSGSMEPVVRFRPAVLRSGSSSFFPAVLRFRQLFFRRFHGFAVQAGSKPVVNGSGSGTVSSGSRPVRFRVTRSVAITKPIQFICGQLFTYSDFVVYKPVYKFIHHSQCNEVLNKLRG